MDRFIERLYEYIKNHFGERMVGYYLVEDKNGIIEGRIDNLCLSNWSRDSVNMQWEDE